MVYSGRFTIQKQDNLYYNFFRMKRKLAGLAIMTFVILALLLALVRYAQGLPVTDSLFSALLIASIGTVLLMSIAINSIVLRINKLYKTGKMSDFSVYYTLDKNGIHAKSERGDTEFAWKQILLARETNHAIYLIAGENRAVVIPKGQIASDGELNTLRTMLRKYIAAGRARVAK